MVPWKGDVCLFALGLHVVAGGRFGTKRQLDSQTISATSSKYGYHVTGYYMLTDN
jgi:hypothetical protein